MSYWRSLIHEKVDVGNRRKPFTSKIWCHTVVFVAYIYTVDVCLHTMQLTHVHMFLLWFPPPVCALQAHIKLNANSVTVATLQNKVGLLITQRGPLHTHGIYMWLCVHVHVVLSTCTCTLQMCMLQVYIPTVCVFVGYP